MEHFENNAIIRGELMGLPRFSHENHRKRFFRLELAVSRLSGTVDILPVVAEEKLLENIDFSDGEMLEVHGQIRSHNLRENSARRLLIFVFATALFVTQGEPVNEVMLQGPLCREPTLRRTPLGREICDAMLAVPRAFRRADYLPCILWGRTAQQTAECHIGEQIRLQGRLQSRNYTKVTAEGSENRIAYEISALSAERVEQ